MRRRVEETTASWRARRWFTTAQSGYSRFAPLGQPALSGVSVLLVADFERRDLGGEAIEAKSACIVCALGHPGTGKVLAHELAHVLVCSTSHATRPAPPGT